MRQPNPLSVIWFIIHKSKEPYVNVILMIQNKNFMTKYKALNVGKILPDFNKDLYMRTNSSV